MSGRPPIDRDVALRMLVSGLALAAGITAVMIAILLIRGVLG